MTDNSCAQMIWRIRRLGYVKKLTEFMARFFYISEILVWVIAGALTALPVRYGPMTTGPVCSGSDVPADYYYAPFGIQR